MNKIATIFGAHNKYEQVCITPFGCSKEVKKKNVGRSRKGKTCPAHLKSGVYY